MKNIQDTIIVGGLAAAAAKVLQMDIMEAMVVLAVLSWNGKKHL